MAEARVERRLAAILAADVAGYSRLMGVDEEGTLTALKAHRREIVDPKIAEYRGRIVKTTGDGALVEFASAVDAVRCALEIQQRMAERNSTVTENRRIEFRIGINIGDVIIDEGDVYGDGVNIAAPMQIEPGLASVSNAKGQNVGAKTQRERDYIDALAVMYADYDKVDHRTRIQAYSKAMEQLAQRYPNDDEAQIHFALSLNTSAFAFADVPFCTAYVCF